MANPAPTINQINAFNATQGTTIDFNIIGGTELVRSNRIYIYDLSDNSLICTHLYVSTESIHELPPNTDGSIVYESGKSSADFVNGAQYYAQIQTFTDIGGTEGGSGLSVAKMFWCLDDPTLTIDTIPSTISTTSYNVSATYNANTSVVSNIIQQYQFSLYSATGSLLQSSGVVVGNGEQQGTSTAYDISYNFTGLSVGSSYYVVVDVTTTQGMSVSTQSSTFTVSIDTPTLGEATVVNNACDGYISVTSNLSSEYGGSGSGDIVSFETDSENVFSKLQVTFSPTQTGSGTASPDNVRPIYGVGGVEVNNTGVNIWDEEWVNGYYKQTDGTFVSASNFVACKNLIPITPNTKYFFTKSAIHQVLWYGIEKDFISARTSMSEPIEYISPSNAYYMAFYVGGTYGTTYNNDISINYPSTDHNYHAYDGQTISQEFDVSLTKTSTDTDPYLFKAVGDIYGDRLEEDIVGGTVCWNQLVDPQKRNYTPFSANGITINYNNDGTWTINGTATAATSYLFTTPFNGIIGHKYLAFGYVKVGSNTGSLGFAGTSTDKGNGGIFNFADGYTNIRLNINSGDSFSNTKMRPTVTDLTAYFGNATIADAIYAMEQNTSGSGVSFMRKYFPKLFSADYDTGTLKSVNPTAHKMVGVNIFDGETEVGTINSSGVKVADSSRLRSKNYMPVLPNTEYYVRVNYSSSFDGTLKFYCYDADKNFITDINWKGTPSTLTFTTPINCYYVLFIGTIYRGTSYTQGDICINISNPTINGQYFPYEAYTYDLGNVTLRGIPKLVNGELTYDGDIRKYDGTVTRNYGIVDLGTLNWQMGSSGRFYSTSINNLVRKGSSSHGYNLLFACGYIAENTASLSGLANNGVSIDTGGNIQMRNDAYTTATDFKTSLNGTMAVYELATPTTETTTPFTQIQEVSKYGTLEYVTNNGIPVGHNTTYLTRDIFGGYVDLVSGVLTVDKVMITPNNVYGVATGDGGLTYWMFATNPVAPSNNQAELISNRFAFGGFAKGNCYVTNLGRLIVAVPIDQTLNTVALANTWLENNPTQFCYLLANPLTYQLTPQQIQTLVGTNNVWSEQGDIELSYHIPITNLLVKRQDVDDVSGNWLTLYSQPIEQASDMDFTFIDFLNQYGKTYKYALVPLLTQTQSGVEVEVEGGYTVSDEVQSIFDGVFISDSTGSQKCKANVGYGNVNMNQSVGSITPIGSQYPIIVTNSNNRYHNGSISGMIVPDDYYYNGNLSRIDMVNKRNELEQFLTNKRAKIIKDWNSNIWLVMIMDNIDCSFDNNYGMGIVTFNANWLEVGDPTNQEDLQATGLVDVGGV